MKFWISKVETTDSHSKKNSFEELGPAKQRTISLWNEWVLQRECGVRAFYSTIGSIQEWESAAPAQLCLWPSAMSHNSTTWVRVKYVPKRMTLLLQPADVSWMRPLKVAYFKKWNHWLVHAPKSYTAAGNVKSPGYATVITWISEIWLSIYIFTFLFP